MLFVQSGVILGVWDRGTPACMCDISGEVHVIPLFGVRCYAVCGILCVCVCVCVCVRVRARYCWVDTGPIQRYKNFMQKPAGKRQHRLDPDLSPQKPVTGRHQEDWL